MAGKRGRPRHQPTKAQRADVELLMASGCTLEQIAARLHISEPTFRLAYATEIENGRARGRAQIVAMLVKSARGGNVSAQKKLEEMSRLADASAEVETAVAPATRTPVQGKKEQQQAEATATLSQPTGDWGDDLNPHSVN